MTVALVEGQTMPGVNGLRAKSGNTLKAWEKVYFKTYISVYFLILALSLMIFTYL